ncbi:PREDICTED: non-specific lipid-transfer protein 2-like [Ipomoea nil]|uniref:non-specific lipid-transfer protein 2-like n=1 Tax=Ipomoea nil TaxID=35883 RepID=UPI000901E487|nr:PREDICTED: non-specific lipid-transfer protein 2-like [Ipomoea nil]
MMMKANESSLLVSLCVVVLVMMCGGGMGVGDAAAAVSCSVTELEACLPAMLFGQSPSGECCSKLREQAPCLCEYMRNPSLRPYVDSPNATKIAAACAVAIPTCSIN